MRPRTRARARTQVRSHPEFERRGSDVHVNAPVSLATAVLGGQVRVPGLEGPEVVKVGGGARVCTRPQLCARCALMNTLSHSLTHTHTYTHTHVSLRAQLEPGVQQDTVVVLRGKGVRNLSGGGRGDQHVHVRLAVPKRPSRRQRELMEQFAVEERDLGLQDTPDVQAKEPKEQGQQHEESAGGGLKDRLRKLKDKLGGESKE